MKPQTISVTAPNGDIYTATRDTKEEPWLISFPEGDSRFYGHVGEVKRRMQTLIDRNSVDYVEGVLQREGESVMANTMTGEALRLTREEIVAILEDRGGYQCYERETTAELRGVLISDIEHGILPASVLDYRRAVK